MSNSDVIIKCGRVYAHEQSKTVFLGTWKNTWEGYDLLELEKYYSIRLTKSGSDYVTSSYDDGINRDLIHQIGKDKGLD